MEVGRREIELSDLTRGRSVSTETIVITTVNSLSGAAMSHDVLRDFRRSHSSHKTRGLRGYGDVSEDKTERKGQDAKDEGRNKNVREGTLT